MRSVRHQLVDELSRRLTTRQDEVFACYLCGDSAPQIAKYLGVARSTVQGHLRRMSDRLGSATLKSVHGWYQLDPDGPRRLAAVTATITPIARLGAGAAPSLPRRALASFGRRGEGLA